jgi:hypothetical protein
MCVNNVFFFFFYSVESNSLIRVASLVEQLESLSYF